MEAGQGRGAGVGRAQRQPQSGARFRPRCVLLCFYCVRIPCVRLDSLCSICVRVFDSCAQVRTPRSRGPWASASAGSGAGRCCGSCWCVPCVENERTEKSIFLLSPLSSCLLRAGARPPFPTVAACARLRALRCLVCAVAARGGGRLVSQAAVARWRIARHVPCLPAHTTHLTHPPHPTQPRRAEGRPLPAAESRPRRRRRRGAAQAAAAAAAGGDGLPLGQIRRR